MLLPVGTSVLNRFQINTFLYISKLSMCGCMAGWVPAYAACLHLTPVHGLWQSWLVPGAGDKLYRQRPTVSMASCIFPVTSVSWTTRPLYQYKSMYQ